MFDRIQSEPGRVLLRLRGGLDSEAGEALRDSLVALAAVEVRDVMIDLSDVTFIDGSGVGALSFLFKRLAARGRRLRLVGVTGQPLTTLRSLGLARALGIDDGRARRTLFSLVRPIWAR